jgi:uncharacterized delta-60 repeat protein
MRLESRSRLEDLPTEQVERIERVCGPFDEEWRRGNRPSIRKCLIHVTAAERSVMLGELLAVELEWRRRLGEHPTPAEYIDQFPEDTATVRSAFEFEHEPDAAGDGTEDHPTKSRSSDGGDAASTRLADPIAQLVRLGALTPPGGPDACARLDRFEILGVLGRGGMGIVLEARDPSTGDHVAVKLLRPELANDQETVRLFRREARHISQLEHPNVVKVREIAKAGEWSYFVMDYLPGGPLSRLIRERPMDASRNLGIARKVAAALAFAHSRGLIHRDIKPANILLDGDGQPYLADFGLARPLINDTLLDLDRSQAVGTVAYMSPGLVSNQVEDTRCDIYSFGAVLREMLTGRPPYAGRTVSELLHQVITAPPEPIHRVNPHAHSGLVRIAEGAMARELRHRYATMNDVVDDLDRVAQGLEPVGPPGYKRKTRLLDFLRSRLARRTVLAVLVVSILVSPLMLYRRLSAGALDPTFGDRGKVFTEFAPSHGICRKVLVQPDDKIVAAGICHTPGRRQFAVARYDHRGRPDRSFGAEGKALVEIGANGEVNAAVLQPDGRIVVAGFAGPPGRRDFLIVRLNPDGTPDSRFGDGGKVLTDLGGNDEATGVGLQADGRIVVAGITGMPRRRDFALARYDTDGKLDHGFGLGGKVVTDLDLDPASISDDSALCLGLQSDGRIVVAGFSNRPGSYDFAVVRYNPDGTVDPTFGEAGASFTDLGGRDEVWSLAFQPDGRIVVAGFSWQEVAGAIGFDTLGIRLARLMPDGSPDRSFGEGGRVLTDLPGNDRAFDMGLQADGKIVVVSSPYDSPRTLEHRERLPNGDVVIVRSAPREVSEYDIAVVRYEADGRLDRTFGDAGKVLTDLDSPRPSPTTGVAVQPDGEIVACGGARHGDSFVFAILRYMGSSRLVARWW